MRNFRNSWRIARHVHQDGDIRVTFAAVVNTAVTSDKRYFELLTETHQPTYSRWNRVRLRRPRSAPQTTATCDIRMASGTSRWDRVRARK